LVATLDRSSGLAKGHVVVGWTSEIVHNLLDELDRQAAAPESAAPRPERATDRQQLSLGELSDFLNGFRTRFVRGAVLNQGLTPEEAEKEVDVLQRLLKRVGSLTVNNIIAGDHLDSRLRLGPSEEPGLTGSNR